MALTVKQEKFCQKYIECEGNASEAYRQSYDCKGSSEPVVNNNAYVLLQNDDIAMRIAELNRLHLIRHQTTVDKVIAEYSKLAFLDVTNAFYADGTLKPLNEIDKDLAAAISSIEIEEKLVGEDELLAKIKKIKFSDKTKALDSLAKHLSMFVEKIEHKHTVTLASLVEASYKKEEPNG